MSGLANLRRLSGDERGATLLEFAFIAPSLCLVLLGIIDFGYRSYVESVVQGALHDAARMSTVGDKTGEEIDAHVAERLNAFSEHASVDTETTSYDEFSNLGKPEKITQDTAPLLSYNEGDCFEDANGNGAYDEDRGQSGVGGAEDVVQYTVTIEYKRIVPMGGFLGFPDTQKVKASTVLRNQPFAARNTAAIVCD